MSENIPSEMHYNFHCTINQVNAYMCTQANDDNNTGMCITGPRLLTSSPKLYTPVPRMAARPRLKALSFCSLTETQQHPRVRHRDRVRERGIEGVLINCVIVLWLLS